MISLWIPLRTISLNHWYSGKHWSRRSAAKKEWQAAVGWLCKVKKVQPIPEDEYPVKIVTRSFYAAEKRVHMRQGKPVSRNHCSDLDTSNTFSANKLIEDALVKAGILPDDTPMYVGPHITLPPVRNHKATGALVMVFGEHERHRVSLHL